MSKSHYYSNPDYWTMDRVIHWLEGNDYNKNVIEVFKTRNICGRTFLDVDMSYLMALQNELMLSYSDKRKLAHAIKAFKASEENHANSPQLRSNYNSNRHNLNTTIPNGTGQRYASSAENIAPLIPERKSSNNEHVLDWMKSFNIPKRPYVTTANVNSNTIAVTGVSGTRTNPQHLPAMNHAHYNHTIANGHSGVYQHHNHHHNFPVSPNSPRIAHLNQLPVPSSAASTITSASSPAGSDGTWKLARRRQTPAASTTSNPVSSMSVSYGDQTIHVTPPPPPPQQPQQFIHVTRNSDTFHSLQVTGMHDPRLIKNSIIRKLGLEGKCDNYRFFHENGKHADIPLTDSELSHICQISDHSATNRILVRPISVVSNDDHNYYHAFKQQYPSIANSNNARNHSTDYRYPSSDKTHDSRSIPVNAKGHVAIVDPLKSSSFEKTYNSAYAPKPPVDDTVVNEAVSPRPKLSEPSKSNRSSTSSSDNQDLYQQASEARSKDSAHSLWPVHDSPQSYCQPSLQPRQVEKKASSPSLWAIPPKKSPVVSKPSLWAVPPSNTNDPSGSDKAAPVSLWAVAPSKSTASPTQSPQPSLWAVAPSIQRQKTGSNDDINTESLQAASNTKAMSLWAVPPSTLQKTNQSTSPSSFVQHGDVKSTAQDKDQASPVSLWAVPPAKQNISTATSPVSLWAVAPQPQDERESNENVIKKAPAASLWAVPPSQQHQETTTLDSSKASKTHSQSLFTVSETKEKVAAAISPDNPKTNTEKISQQQDNQHNDARATNKTRTVQFTSTTDIGVDDDNNMDNVGSPASSVASAPELKDGIEELSITSSDEGELNKEEQDLNVASDKHHFSSHSRSNSATNLHVDTIITHDTHRIDDSKLDSPSLSSPSQAGPATDLLIDEENWAERPSVDRLYKDIDKYLPGHDLDKEIIVNEPVTTATAYSDSSKNGDGNHANKEPGETPTMVTSLPSNRRLVGHRKSIRNVAREAHRNWRNAVNVIRANNNLIRRRSTKMWHRNVEQVKPGDKIEPITPTVPSETGSSTVMDYQEQGSQQQQKSDGGIVPPKSRKLQWIRGELIGKGSFGRVYHALNVEAGEWIAVKQVDLPTSKSDYGGNQSNDMKDALFREISLLEDLDNEYVVQYLGYDVDQAEGYINIFLEYVPGGSIASCLAKTGKFEVPLVRFFTRQILMGVAYLHSRNVLHRDIKAGNILLDQNGVCKITDFGLSKLSGQDKAYDPHSNNSVMRGTVFWMAPEVVKGTKYNAKVDIWSLGCTVIEMLTGKHPWLDLNMLAALYSLGKYQAPPIPEDIPEDVQDFLKKCFIINPEERPTAEQLLSHSFVQPDPTFDFKKYMRKAELDRRQSRKVQQQHQHHQHYQQHRLQTDQQTHTIPVKN